MKGPQAIAEVTRTLASKSSMNPTLILAAIVVPLCSVLGYLSEGNAQLFFFGLCGAIIIIALLQIVGFSIFAPDRLDDHKHTENKMLIAQIRPHFGDADDTNFIQDESVVIENPLLSKGEEG